MEIREPDGWVANTAGLPCFTESLRDAQTTVSLVIVDNDELTVTLVTESAKFCKNMTIKQDFTAYPPKKPDGWVALPSDLSRNTRLRAPKGKCDAAAPRSYSAKQATSPDCGSKGIYRML